MLANTNNRSKTNLFLLLSKLEKSHEFDRLELELCFSIESYTKIYLSHTISGVINISTTVKRFLLLKPYKTQNSRCNLHIKIFLHHVCCFRLI